jgi:hypothetical protein
VTLHDFTDAEARPPSIAEWEDVLIRVEIAPRALRVAADDAGDGPAVRAVLARAAAAEAAFDDVIAAMRDGTEVPAAAVEPGAGAEGEEGDAAALVDRYAQRRGRIFAQVQRRGLYVWDWASPLPGGGTLTCYQLMTGMARHDGETLAAVRAAGGR